VFVGAREGNAMVGRIGALALIALVALVPGAFAVHLPSSAPACGAIPDGLGGTEVPLAPLISEPIGIPGPEPPGPVHIVYNTFSSIGVGPTDLGVLLTVSRGSTVLARRENDVNTISEAQRFTWRPPGGRATYVARVDHFISYTGPDGAAATCAVSDTQRFLVDQAAARRSARAEKILAVDVEKDLARGLIRWDVGYDFRAGDVPCLLRDEDSPKCERWKFSTVETSVVLRRGGQVVSRDGGVGVVENGSGKVVLAIPYGALPRGRYTWTVSVENPLNFTVAKKVGRVALQ
jgi:hypothetical protein